MSGADARAALSYWRASRRLLRADQRMHLSSGAANVILIKHALDGAWPRLTRAATVTLVLLRRAETNAETAPTSGARSRSRGRRRRRPRD